MYCQILSPLWQPRLWNRSKHSKIFYVRFVINTIINRSTDDTPYNKSQKDATFLNFILVKNSTHFGQTCCPSSGVLILHSHQLVFVILSASEVRMEPVFDQNKVEKLCILLAFIIRIYQDARSCECPNGDDTFHMLGSCHTGHYKRYDGNAIAIRHIRHDTGPVHRRRSTQTIYFSTNMLSDEEDTFFIRQMRGRLKKKVNRSKYCVHLYFNKKWRTWRLDIPLYYRMVIIW